jgi:hypothetical protein
MVEDKLPGTLLTDSMASFLMAQQKVNVVVTGTYIYIHIYIYTSSICTSRTRPHVVRWNTIVLRIHSTVHFFRCAYLRLHTLKYVRFHHKRYGAYIVAQSSRVVR